ncbi:MAG: TIGR03915 family putative DNA repair protein [Granulosicoccus sp.]
MRTAIVAHAADFSGWRDKARNLLVSKVDPSDIHWQVSNAAQDLFAEPDLEIEASATTTQSTFRVPQSFMQLATRVVCHSDPQRFALLYRVLWRLTHGEPNLLTCCSDNDVHVVNTLAKAVSRDRHKMTAFVRFRKTQDMTTEHYSAWFEPSHYILRLTIPFFCKRFSNMHWSIHTPEGSAHWNGTDIVFGPPGTRDDIPQGEIMEDIWRTYFANTFNPARLRISAMQAEMPVKYWKNLPEAPLIAELIHDSGRRVSDMIASDPTSAPRFAEAAMKSAFRGRKRRH